MHTKKFSLLQVLMFGAFLSLLGYGLGTLSYGLFHGHSPARREAEDVFNNQGLGAYRYTNALLACGDIDNLSVGSMDTLKQKLEKTLNERMAKKEITRASIYIRDLDNGPWLGINEKEEFFPASLLKVPFIFATYQEEEKNPGFLDRTVSYNRAQLSSTYLFPPKEPIELGETYSMRELLRRSIIYSDNEAAALLGNEVSFQNLSNIFWDFGISRPEPGEDYKMKVRTYASFFRILYNASYISRAHSEEALTLLTESSFTDGIVAGVPKHIKVAHKFGEREGTLENGDVQLHDCGIVYSSARPYLICVMAQAPNTDNILSLMRYVSRETYDAMTKD